MSLTDYISKRNFHKTPEPKVTARKRKSEGLKFVVQKHNASHLHYDFRLELDGTLKSWAVPKGPSLNPAHKRLAMMVEDHPLSYARFEGTIPEGNYGAGTVIVWDEGTYTPYESKGKAEDEKLLKSQLQKGHLTIILSGKKLKGEFALVKMAGREENAWLLIKKNDAHATDREITLDEASVISGKSKKAKTESKNVPAKKLDLSAYPKSRMPRKIEPMLTTLVDKAFDDKEWIFEIKWDGYRVIAEVEKGKVKLFSRHGKDYSGKFTPISEALSGLPYEAILDGEVVVLDNDGRPDFQSLQNYFQTGKGNLTYVVFDLLHLNGHDLMGAPLAERKKLLSKILPKSPTLSYSEHVETKGLPFFEAAKAKGLEGIVAKKATSLYHTGVRGMDWQKIKTRARQEAVICGFTKPQGSRANFGALILGVYRSGKLEFAGHTGGGFTETQITQVYEKMRPLIRRGCPFDEAPKTNTPATWLKPLLVCEVEFSEWTGEGLMRQPVFMGLREDKLASEVMREEPLGGKFFGGAPPQEIHKEETTVKIGKQNLKLTHLNKVFWPEEKITKGDLISYYREIAPVLLPYLKDRPESLLRFPDGIEGKSFFHKDVGELVPDWIETTKVHLESEDRYVNYCLCQDEASLVYLINLGCIDINPWNSRVGHKEHPDFAIIDLDPEDVPFSTVVEVAIAMREVLESAGIKAYCKTSGASGIHIYIPLAAKYSYESARTLCLVIASLVNKKLPQITSLERSPQKRQGKVYLDCFQNSRGQTLASVYSVRPVPGACVSTPLEWDELTSKLLPSDFTMKNIFSRLQKKGDLFKPVLGSGISIEAAIKNLEQ